MKTIILAGGLGTRLAEETDSKPKPMVMLDENPILWHIMRIYIEQGFNEFVIALGYKGEIIKRWAKDLVELKGSFEISSPSGNFKGLVSENQPEFKITALETGLQTLTGLRIKRCYEHIGKERIFATYGDGLGNVNLEKLLNSHLKSGKIATLTAVRPVARFGYLELNDQSQVVHFGEKNQMDAGWINGGFFVFEPEILNFIGEKDEPFETGALARLAAANQLNAYKHDDFWQPMDTLREKYELIKLAAKEIPDWLNFN